MRRNGAHNRGEGVTGISGGDDEGAAETEREDRGEVQDQNEQRDGGVAFGLRGGDDEDEAHAEVVARM